MSYKQQNFRLSLCVKIFVHDGVVILISHCKAIFRLVFKILQECNAFYSHRCVDFLVNKRHCNSRFPAPQVVCLVLLRVLIGSL